MTGLSPEQSFVKPASSSTFKAILKTWLIAGTMDLSMAIIVWSFVLQKISVLQLFQGISSGVFGKDAFTRGSEMIIYGGIFHYIIAFCFTTGYFLVFPYVPFLRKQKIISGLLYGIFAWAWMKYVVLPFTQIQSSPFNWTNAIISASILMVCIGLPISLMAHKYYSGKH